VASKPEAPAEHGAHRWWVAVLGAVLMTAAVAFLWSSFTGLRDRERVAREGVVAVAVTAPPYVVEPVTRIRAAGQSQRPDRSPHAGVPVRIVVPRLHVDAPVVPISAAGRMLVPPGDPQTLGWWDGGAVPGAAHGGALITGHTVHTGGGAFDDLEALRPGDRVRVRTAVGRVRYVVTGVTVYRKISLARDAERVFRQSGPGRLVLVTCEDWNGSVYLSNAVVFADPL
jgi:LPXTG-site transpeptidase (sortase) family protein